MIAVVFLASALAAGLADPVLDFYRGTWRCEGSNGAHQRYSLTFRYTRDPDVPPVLRSRVAYSYGKRRGVLSGMLGRSGTGTYVEVGARPNVMWVASTAGWHGDTLIWYDVAFPGAAEHDRATVHRVSADAFTDIDERLDARGTPAGVNTTESCRRVTR